jgi:hypothetical protein
MFIQFTIFEDLDCTKVRQFGQLDGHKGRRYFEALTDIKGSKPVEREIVCGVRIDRIGSEDILEAGF